ncbi:hypothetical protein P4110_02925 [Pseudomonas aeruginosa]|nr:hypothetical protein [Pseudomonas aeruginosa]
MLFSVAHPVRAASPPLLPGRALLAALLLALLAPLARPKTASACASASPCIPTTAT